MTRYLIIALVGLILITALVLFFNSPRQTPEPTPTPLPIAQPSKPGSIRTPSTSPVIPLPSEDLVKYQSETDKIYADKVKEQDEKYPWLEQLPLETSNYFVYFEISTNTFTAEINNSQQSEQIKQEILNNLTALNIDTTKYNINWQIKTR